MRKSEKGLLMAWISADKRKAEFCFLWWDLLQKLRYSGCKPAGQARAWENVTRACFHSPTSWHCLPEIKRWVLAWFGSARQSPLPCHTEGETSGWAQVGAWLPAFPVLLSLILGWPQLLLVGKKTGLTQWLQPHNEGLGEGALRFYLS